MPVVEMPNGDLVEFPDDMPDEEIGSFIQSRFPDAFAPQETTALGQVGETLKAIPRGFGRTLLTAAEGAGELADAATNFVGLENLIDSGDDNALVSAARQGQKALNESWLGVDDAYQDEWFTKFGEGLGSMATFFTPTAALRLAGLTGRATKTTAALASATGSGEQAQRIEQARAEGLDVTGGQEDTAILTGAIIGLSELAPVERILRGIDPGKATDDVKTVIMKRLSSAFASGGMEALQETSASLLQDLAEREIYNPDVDFGQEALDSFTIGGAVGFTADLVVNAMAGRRGRDFSETQKTDELQFRKEEEERGNLRRKELEPAPTAEDIDVPRIRSEMRESGDANLVALESQLSDDQIREIGGVTTPVVEEELDPATIPPKSDNMANYAKDIAVQMGRNFPTQTSFNIEQISIPVDETTSEPAFQVVDSEGQSYGSPLKEYEQAAVLAGTLNREIVDQSVRNVVNNSLDNTTEEYDTNVPIARVVSKDGRSVKQIPKPITGGTAELSQRESLEVIGNRIKNPRANEITADALNVAADTTMDQGFEENLTAEQAMQRNMGRVFTEEDMVNSLTASQRVNRKRLARGLPETNKFTVTEAKEVLGKDFGKLGDIGAGGIVETQKYSVGKDKKGNPIVVSSLGEVITSKSVQKIRKKDGKLYTQKRKLKTENDARILADRLNSRYDQAVDEVVFEDIKAGNAEIKALLERKNIPNELDSPAIKTMAKAFVGKENVNDMDTGEKKFFYQKIRKLPVVPSPLAEGLPDFDQASTLTQGVEVDAEPLALPAPDRELPSPELVADMQERLNAELKRKNLSDQGVTGRIFQEFRDYGLNKEDQPVFTSEVLEETEGGYLKDFNEIAVGVRQALQFHEENTGTKVDMSDGDAVFAVIKDVLNHETVHALRRLDLFTAEEYRVLEKAAENTKRQGEDITYLQDAEVRYSDLPKTQRMEEAVAELVRQNTDLGGRPRTIINKIKDILEAIARFISGSPPTVQRIVAGIESGDIGARTVGDVRTLRATRESLDLYEYQNIDDVAPAGSQTAPKIGDTLEELERQLQPIEEVTVAEIDEQPIARSTKSNRKFIQAFVDKGNLILGEASYFPDGRLEHKNHFKHQKAARGISDEQVQKAMYYGNMFKAYPDGKNRPPGLIFRGEDTTVVGEIRGSQLVLKTVYETNNPPPKDNAEKENFWKSDANIAYSRAKKIPKKTQKAYKLFRINPKQPGKLFPLYVDSNTPVPVGEWVEAIDGGYSFVAENGKRYVPAKTGDGYKIDRKTARELYKKGFATKPTNTTAKAVAYRPGWHSGDLPSSQHIGGISEKSSKKKKDFRQNDQVWAEIEVADDVDYQEEANSRAGVIKSGPKKGMLKVKEAHLANKGDMPKGGHYRYKTNPDMEGEWMISGEIKVNRVLSDAEVAKINKDAGRTPDLPRIAVGPGRNKAGPRLDGGSIAYSRRGITIPEASSTAPILPVGEVEAELQSLLDRTNGNPTSEELSEIPGAPKKRMIKNKKGERVPDLVRDGEVKPTPLSRLRQMARKGLREAVGDLNWYDQFGQGLVDIVGEANIDEASVIFGITSTQNPAENNLADTLHIMSVAREFDPVTNTSKFIEAVKVKPDGKKLFIGGDQINRIVRMYNEGMAEGGLKTTTYMQLIQDRARNVFNPFSVQDVHMSRVFGFRRKGYNDKGELVDASVIPGDLQYRYAQYLTSYLAKEFGVTPNQMQAALWFVGKKNLSDKVTKPGEGTWKSAARYSAPEIKRIEKQVEDGSFDKNTPLTPALEKGIRPKNASKVKSNPFTNHLQIADLRELAAQRAPRVVASANPGNGRGYGFPDSVSFEDLISFNEGAIDVITDEKGQIPFIRQLGIDHVVESSLGSYEGVEPGIQVRLLDSNLKQANFIAQVLGDGLLQDAVLTSEPNINSDDRVGIAITKADGSKFTQEEIMAMAAKANPENDPYGLNFTAYNDNQTIAFLDGRTFDRESLPEYTDEMAVEFKNKVVNAFDSDVNYVYTPYRETGEYYESKRYLSSPRERGLERGVTGSSDILSIANDTLYKPFWDYYTAEAERIGFTPQNLTPPAPTRSSINLFPRDLPVIVPQVVQPRSIPPAEVEAAVEKNLEALENTTGGAVPTFSVKASPEAQAVARKPELGVKPTKEQDIVYSRRSPRDPEVKAVVDKVIQPESRKKSLFENIFSKSDDYQTQFSKFRQDYVNRYEPLEKMDKMMRDTLGTLADSSAHFAMIMSDRSSNLTAASIKHGIPVRRDGMFKTEDFMYGENKVDGLLGVFKNLMPSENVFNENLLEVWQSYAIAKRAKEINESGKLSPVPKGEEDAFLAEMEAIADKYINPRTNKSYIREVYDMYQAYNNQVINLMRDSGLITDQEARSWERSSTYYPFYRDFEADPNAETNQETGDGKLVNVDSILNVGMENSPSFLPQDKIGSQKLRRLEGSRLKIDVPPLEAVVKNLDAAINMSMKNIAYQRAMRDAVYLGFASKIEPGRKMKALKKGEISNDIYIRENGKDVRYKVHDQLLFSALQPISDGSLVTRITEITSMPARFLRESVTRSPGFMLVNMLRDTLSAFVTSGASFTPIIDTAKNFRTDLTEFEKLGVVTGYDNISDPKDLAAYLSKEMRKKNIDTGASKTTKAWENSLGKAWDLLGAGTTKSDFATRKAVYDDVLARTGSQAEAAYQAIEVLNFGRRGGNAAYRMFAAATPFLNARIQGLDVLWRTGLGTYSSRSDLGKAQIQRNALLRASYLTGLTAAYWMLMSDDDQYKEASDYVRDNNWLIPNPFGNEPMKIPIPFEIGLLFKTFPERLLDASFKESTARDFAQTVGRGAITTLEMNPFGIQIAAPLVEVGFNKNFYTGRQIVPYYIDQGVVAGLQDRVTTTEFAEWLGQSTGMSPLKIDHVINGYAGSLGMVAIDMVDNILRSPAITGDFAASMPTYNLSENPAFRRFFARAEGTGLAEDFYEMNRYVGQIVQTLNKLEKEERIEEYQKFLVGREHLLDFREDFNAISNELSELRREKQDIIRADIHPDSKRDQVNEIDRIINERLQVVPLYKELVRLPVFRESTFKEGGP